MQDHDWLARLILDMNRTVRPALAIVDAITAMEGEGPSSGEPRDLGLILAGADPVAVDAVAGELLGQDPDGVPLLRVARQQSYGCADLDRIEVHGESIADYRQPDWHKIDKLGDIRWLVPLPLALLRRLREYFVPYPVIDRSLCIHCNRCHAGCPVAPAAIHPGRYREQLDFALCIRCYCCLEFWPVKAIRLRRPFLERHLGFVRLTDFVSRLISWR